MALVEVVAAAAVARGDVEKADIKKKRAEVSATSCQKSQNLQKNKNLWRLYIYYRQWFNHESLKPPATPADHTVHSNWPGTAHEASKIINNKIEVMIKSLIIMSPKVP